MVRAIATGFLVVLFGCGGGDDRSSVEVMEAFTWAGSDVVSLTVDSCNASPSVTVEEGAREVRITVEADTPGPNKDDCADGAVACLGEPLGGRVLVDDVSGEEFVAQIVDGAVPSCPTVAQDK